MTRAAKFTEADVSRAIKGARAAGAVVREVLCTGEGVRLVLDDGATRPKPGDAASAFEDFAAGQ